MTSNPLVYHLSRAEINLAAKTGSITLNEVFSFTYNAWTCRPGRRVFFKKTRFQNSLLTGRIVAYERIPSHLLDFDDACRLAKRTGSIECDVAVITIKIENEGQAAA